MAKKLDFELGAVFTDSFDFFIVAKNGGSNPVFLRGESREGTLDFSNPEILRMEELGLLPQEGQRVGRIRREGDRYRVPGFSAEVRVPENFSSDYQLQ